MEGPGKSRRSGAAAYENQPAVERLDAERSARRHADRKTTAAASLQVNYHWFFYKSDLRLVDVYEGAGAPSQLLERERKIQHFLSDYQ